MSHKKTTAEAAASTVGDDFPARVAVVPNDTARELEERVGRASRALVVLFVAELFVLVAVVAFDIAVVTGAVTFG